MNSKWLPLATASILGQAPRWFSIPPEGALMKVNGDGSVTVIASELNLPTSLETIANTTYVVSLADQMWTVQIEKDQPWAGSR